MLSAIIDKLRESEFMSRAKHHSIETKAFTSYVKDYFDKYHEISERFREETKDGGRPSKDTINAMTNHYNSSTLREKYIAALAAQEEKLLRSRHVDASKYLKEVQAKLETLFKKDLPGFANKSASKNQWLDFTKRYSESAKRNPVRESAKGGTQKIHDHIMAMLAQGRKLNQDQIKDNDIGDIFFKAQKDILGRSKTIYAGGATLTSVAGVLSATIELKDHLIGNMDFINDDVTKTNTDSSTGEGVDNGGGGGGEGGETGGDAFENGSEIFSQTQVFQALQYAILIAMIVMLIVIVAVTVTNLCSQIERERQAKEKADDSVTEKLDGKEKRKEEKYTKRAEFLEELEAITEKSR